MRTAFDRRRQRSCYWESKPRVSCDHWVDPDAESPQGRVSAVIHRLGEGGKEPGEITADLRHLCAIAGVESPSDLPAAIPGMFPRNQPEAEQLIIKVRAAIAREKAAPARAALKRLFQ